MRQQVAQLAALLTGAGLLFAGSGLVGVLVPLRASLEGFPRPVIGLLSTAFSVGFLAGCLATPALLRRVGHVRTFAVLAAVASCALLSLPLGVTPVPWVAARVVIGACNAGLFMAVESWINERSLPEQRGRLFAVYMVLNLGSVTVGQMGLAVADPREPPVFLVAAMLVTLSLVPVGLTRTPNPEPIEAARLKLGKLYASSPVAVAGCLVAGLVSGAFGGLGVVYAVELGLSPTGVAVFMSAAVIGGAALQLPVGRLSDAFDRRSVLLGTCVASSLLGAALASLPAWAGDRPSPSVLGAFAFAYGAAIFCVYGLAIAHANDKAQARDHVEIAGGLLLVWAIGAMTGPLVASALMEISGPGGVFWTTAAAHAGLALFTVVRMTRTAAPGAEEKVAFEVEPIGTRPTPATILLHPHVDPAAGGSEPERPPSDDGARSG